MIIRAKKIKQEIFVRNLSTTKNDSDLYHKVHFFYTLGVLVSLIVVSIIAQAKFSTKFSIFLNTISEQGSIAMNPLGGKIWRIGVIINGIAHIPHNLFIYKNISPINRFWSKISMVLSLIAAIGFSFVGAIPVDYGDFHNLASIFAFVGYYISAILSFIIIYSKNSPLHDMMINSKIAAVFVIYFLFSGAGCLLSSILSSKFSIFALIYPILEWNYLLAICTWFLLWIFLLPKLNK